ncbi:FMN-linked oxidoreductase [Lepidopterella palustris CBS 459.81]|uniref:FMN-linked oxidoreductase n=1 Tax=Lepidopterella palustris CBS 459.81 TaxID=1314670 RepID=A0A8E2JE04_9PEZI|nr:FMN-linked oxidoreductase [Lepidopterella palustris CBS 459.81]
MQLAHLGHMSPARAGGEADGDADYGSECCASVLPKLFVNKLLGTPREITYPVIDAAITNFIHGSVVSRDDGFAGCQLPAALGFLISAFLFPHTSLYRDEYGGTTEKRMRILQRLAHEIREQCPRPFPG